MKLKSMLGVTLMEMLVFLVVLSILTSGFFIAYREILTNVDQPGQISIATERAQARLDLIMGQKRRHGYANFIDPCDVGSPSPICVVTTRVAPVVLPPSTTVSTVTLVVTGQSDDGSVEVTLTSLLGNY